MRILPLLAVASLTFSTQAYAASVLDLPAGQVELKQNPDQDPGFVALAGGKEVGIDSAYEPQVMARHGDSVMLQVYSGGNACPADYVWLTFDATGLRVTPPFGTCSEAGEIVETAGYPSITMAGMGAVLGDFRYDFDGATVTETPIKADDTAEPAPIPASWEGRSAYELIDDQRMRTAFMSIMPKDRLGELRQAVELSGDGDALRKQGDWLVGSGCRAALCDVESGRVAISLTDGRVIAMLHNFEGGDFFGKGAADVLGADVNSEYNSADTVVDPETLPGYWAVVAINGKAVSELVDDSWLSPSVEFDASGTVSGQSFCNRWISKATIDKDAIVISDLSSTRMACPHQAAESALLEVLTNARNIVVTDDGLELRTQSGNSVLMVRPG